jgi:hypothetical protein
MIIINIAGTVGLTKIPSIEKTEDFIYRFEIKRGTPLHDPNEPHLLAFENGTSKAGIFHSLDVTVFRDGQKTVDVELQSFEHWRDSNLTCVRFKFHDTTHNVIEHDYLLSVILRYLEGH